MKYYPILFSVRDPVIGKGFIAGVASSGRCLMREEPDGFWIDGVNPGAVCAGGASRDEALLKFRENYRSILYDSAAMCSSFEEFKQEVERFFWEVTPGEPEAWVLAVEDLRANPGKAGDWLPVRQNYEAPSIKVVCLSQESLVPDRNAEGQVELAAAAA